MGPVRGVRMGSWLVCKALIQIGCGRTMGSFGIFGFETRGAGAGGSREA